MIAVLVPSLGALSFQLAEQPMPDPLLLIVLAVLASLAAVPLIVWARHNQKRTGRTCWGLWNTGMTLVAAALLLAVAATATP